MTTTTTETTTPLVTVTATKPTPDAMTGVGVVARGDKIFVKTIADDSIFKNTHLCKGFEVVTVNGEPCQGKTIHEVTALIKSATSEVTIEARESYGRIAAAILTKTSPEMDVGIIWKKDESTGNIYIHQLDETSPFIHRLPQGKDYHLKAINTHSMVGKETKEIKAEIDAIDSVLMIEMEKVGSVTTTPVSVKAVGDDAANVPPPRVATTATIEKTSPDMKVGIFWAKDESTGNVYINRFKDTSPFLDCLPQGKGYCLKSINGQNMKGRETKEVTAAIASVTSVLTIEMEYTGTPVPSNFPPGVAGAAPPPGAPEGGSWGSITYAGRQTQNSAWVCCVLAGWPCALMMLECCPQDEKPVYKHERSLYNVNGSKSRLSYADFKASESTSSSSSAPPQPEMAMARN